MIKYCGKTYHLRGIEVDGNINMKDGEIMNLQKLSFDKWAFVIDENEELCITYDDSVKLRITNTNIPSDLYCERYFMIQPVNVDDCIGMFVSSSSQFYNKDISQRPTTEEAQPTIFLSNKPYDPTIVGVIYSYEKYERINTIGNIQTTEEQNDDINRVLVVNKGTTSVLVCDVNGNFSNGDYITTSGVAGYGMRQPDFIKCNYTGPKITQNCNFNPGFILLQKPVSFDDTGPVFEPVTTPTDDVITDVEYEIKYIDLEGNPKTKKQFIKELTKLAKGKEIYEPGKEGVILEELLFNPSRTILRVARVGCCFI